MITAPNPHAVAITPDQAPVAAFEATAAPPGSPTIFDASGSSDPDGQIVTYAWDFGDGTALADGGPNPTHAYAAPGTYTATLTVTDGEGCSTTLVFTGQTASCNGAPSATATKPVTVASTPPPSAPGTKITKAKIDAKHSKAKFKFEASGSATAFQCQLKRKHAHRKAKFKDCDSPKTYKHLKPGKYKFAVQAVGAGGTDSSPAKKRFKIT